MLASYEGRSLSGGRPAFVKGSYRLLYLAGSQSFTYSQFFVQIHPPMLQYIHAQIKLFSMKDELP